jgi:hypothetical protein
MINYTEKSSINVLKPEDPCVTPVIIPKSEENIRNFDMLKCATQVTTIPEDKRAPTGIYRRHMHGHAFVSKCLRELTIGGFKFEYITLKHK